MDGCDLKPALLESMKTIWNGDEDLLDGCLTALRQEYELRRSGFSKLPMGKVLCNSAVLQADKDFIQNGLKEAIIAFNAKEKVANSTDASLMAASWNVAEYNSLMQLCELFSKSIHVDHIKYLEYLRNLFKKKSS